MDPRKRRRLEETGQAADDGFLAFDDGESEEEEEEEDQEREEPLDDMEGKEATAQPLALDWSCSDLLLEIRGDAPSQSFGSSGRSGQSGHGSRGLRVGTSTPVWALGRGVSPAYQGRHRWKLRVLRLAKDSSESAASPESPPPPPPSLLFGVLAQFPGARPMPSAALGDPAGEGVESEEPALALLAAAWLGVAPLCLATRASAHCLPPMGPT